MSKEEINVEKPSENVAPAGAIKYDQGKSPVYRGSLAYFPRAIEGLATISAFGATKYAWSGWRHVPDGLNRYTDAMVRHLLREGQEEILDPDSGLPHHLHTLWNAAARSELMLIDEALHKSS